MNTHAAVLRELNQPLEVVEIEIPPLKPGQVLVEIAFTGVCHTQLGEVRGRRGADNFLPHCLGHEASGTVVSVGPEVRKVAEGDQVIVSWIKGSGADVPGTVYQWNGADVNAGGATTFARHSVVSENRVTKLVPGLSMKDASYIGCALPTGAGAVVNTAQPRPGQSLAVFGVGGVGLCAIIGARMAGCYPIVAVDLLASKLEAATELGATATVDASREDVEEALRRACPDGLDVAIEATGQPAVMLQAIAAVRNQGGKAVIIGNARFGDTVALDPRQFNMGKQLLGTWGGDTVPDRDYPVYGRLLGAGRISLSPLQGSVYSLTNINEALDDLEAGRAVRPLVDLSLQ